MARTAFRSVEEYLAAQPAETQPILAQVRQAIRKALPDAEELISYQIPAYRVNGRVSVYFAGWQAHYSIYPASKALVAAFSGRLENGELRGSTLRFPLAEPVPADLIGEIAQFRAAEVAELFRARAAARSAAKKALKKPAGRKRT